MIEYIFRSDLVRVVESTLPQRDVPFARIQSTPADYQTCPDDLAARAPVADWLFAGGTPPFCEDQSACTMSEKPKAVAGAATSFLAGPAAWKSQPLCSLPFDADLNHSVARQGAVVLLSLHVPFARQHRASAGDGPGLSLVR